MSKNIKYQTSNLAEYFINSRRTWDEFYPSERWVFSRIGDENKGFGSVLDVGCAVGGLGRALSEKYELSAYTGLDINEQAIEYANSNVQLNIETAFHCDDIVTTSLLGERQYDSVFALSVADWNVDTYGILEACWRRVKPGGRLIISQRLSNLASVLDPETSYQYILPQGQSNIPQDVSDVETAPYMVLNVTECFRILTSLKVTPEQILAYGYWGTPSKTAVTPFDKIAFAVLSIAKPIDRLTNDVGLECHLPADLFC